MDFIRVLRKLASGQKGLSGVETAIILVSTVAVAGTLATTVLASGVSSAEDADTAVEEGLRTIMGTFIQKGAVIGKAATTGPRGAIGQLTFSVTVATSGGSVDFTPPAANSNNNGLADPAGNNTIVISYIDRYQQVDNLYWTVTPLGKSDGDYLLEDREQFQIEIGGSPVPGEDGGNLVDALDTDLSTDTPFTIQITSADGATLFIERRTPVSFDKIINFY